MIYIESKYLPPKGYQAMSLFGVCIKRKDASPMSDISFNHEAIHERQQGEVQTFCLIVSIIICSILPSIWWLVGAILFHPVLYSILCVIYGVKGWIKKKSFLEMWKAGDYYYNNPLEREAYAKESEMNYLSKRYPFSWIKFII